MDDIIFVTYFSFHGHAKTSALDCVRARACECTGRFPEQHDSVYHQDIVRDAHADEGNHVPDVHTVRCARTHTRGGEEVHGSDQDLRGGQVRGRICFSARAHAACVCCRVVSRTRGRVDT